MITGINHITIAVKDLERSFLFYRNVLQFKPLMRHSKGAYFLAGNLWFCLDLDVKTRSGPLPEYTHIAFSVSQSNFHQVAASIKSADLKIWKENKSEGDSIYFLDPDGHKLEVHVGDWRSRLKSIEMSPWNSSVEIFFKDEQFDAKIRQAREDENIFLSGLAMRSKSYWPYPPDYLQKCVNVLKLEPNDIRSWPVYAYEKNNEVVGFFALKPVSGENRLDHLWIDPRFIGQGIGKSLFLTAVAKAKELGWSKFRIAADPYAEDFYLKMGAKKIGTVQSRIKPDLFLPHLELDVLSNSKSQF